MGATTLLFRFRIGRGDRVGTRQRELARRAVRACSWPCVTRAPRGLGAGLGSVAAAAEWTGFGRLSGRLAVGAVGALLLAFALHSSLAAAAEGDDWTNTPNMLCNTGNG